MGRKRLNGRSCLNIEPPSATVNAVRLPRRCPILYAAPQPQHAQRRGHTTGFARRTQPREAVCHHGLAARARAGVAVTVVPRGSLSLLS